MKHALLIRLGGLVAVVGSVAYAMANLALWFSEPPFSRVIQTLDRDRTIQTLDNIFFVFLVLGALAAIAALYTLHREFYGMTETLVSLVAFVSTYYEVKLSGHGWKVKQSPQETQGLRDGLRYVVHYWRNPGSTEVEVQVFKG